MKLNLENESVKELMALPKEELVKKLLANELILSKIKLNFKKEKACAEWLDVLADSLRDGDEEKEQEAEELFEDYQKKCKENRVKFTVLDGEYSLTMV